MKIAQGGYDANNNGVLDASEVYADGAYSYSTPLQFVDAAHFVFQFDNGNNKLGKTVSETDTYTKQ